MEHIQEIIFEAIQKRKIFIGYMMLCRYLNGKGYIRYGCNAGYPKDDRSGNARINPCPILCPNTEFYPSKIKYHIKKLGDKNLIYIEKRLFYDSRNPNSDNYEHKIDLFVIIAKSKEIFDKFMEKNTLEKYLEADSYKKIK